MGFEMTKITISLIKADVGGYPGHSSVHPALIETAESKLAQAKKAGALIDFRVMACGDDHFPCVSWTESYSAFFRRRSRIASGSRGPANTDVSRPSTPMAPGTVLALLPYAF